MLRAGIVGLPNVGKSTLFNALTSSHNAQSANFPFCTIEPNVGVVNVPDERLYKLAKLVKTDVIIPTAIEFVDIAGLVKGASKGEGLGNQFLANIREVDAIIQVVRCFDDENTIHVSGKVNPIDDVEIINTELALADITSIEKRLEKISKQAKSGDKNAILEQKVYTKLRDLISNNSFVNIYEHFEDDELLIAKASQLMCIKPVIYVANVGEADLAKGNKYVDALNEYVKTNGADVVIISAQIEAELAELSSQEALDYLQDLGVTSSGIERMINVVYKLLDLVTFITAGEKEVRAWTVKAGSKAPKAAGVIHTDFEKGFIRAEITSYSDFIDCGSYAVARERGLTRLEGKDYIIQDGDIVHFRFNC